MELHRGGGPGDRPPLDQEQQRQLELQQQMEREQRVTEQTPQVMAQLGKELDQHPTLGPQLKQYNQEQQEEIKKALTDGITQRTGHNGLQRIDAIAPTKDGGIIVNFNEFRSVYLKGDQLPTLADGSRPIKIGEPARSAMPEQSSGQERQSPSREPAQQRTQPDLASSVQRERETAEFQRPAQERTLPAPGEYTSLNNLAQRQQQEQQNAPLDDRHVAKPHFENGVLAVKPIPYTNPFSLQPISHEPQQRQNDIQTLLEPKLGHALDSYNPTQQNQLKQALTEEISDITGGSLKIDHIEKLDDGRLAVELNRGLHQVYIDPQQVLQPEREQPRSQPPLTIEEQQRQDTQRQLQDKISQLGQHTPIDQMIMESRLREAVGDERIESLRIEGEDTIQLGLRNGMVLTASTHELLNMTNGRELLNRSQADSTAQNSHNAEAGNLLVDPRLKDQALPDPIAVLAQAKTGAGSFQRFFGDRSDQLGIPLSTNLNVFDSSAMQKQIQASGHRTIRPSTPTSQTSQPDKRGVTDRYTDWIDEKTKPARDAYQRGETAITNSLRVEANDESLQAYAKRYASSQLAGILGSGHWAKDAVVGTAHLSKSAVDIASDNALSTLDRLSGDTLSKSFDTVRDARERQGQREDTAMSVLKGTFQLYQHLDETKTHYLLNPDQLVKDTPQAARVTVQVAEQARQEAGQIVGKQLHESRQGYRTADLQQNIRTTKVALDTVTIVAPELVALKTARAARGMEAASDVLKGAEGLELSRGGRTLRQSEKALEHGHDALRPAQQQALQSAERAQEELNRATLDALNKQGEAVRAEKQALETGTEQTRKQAEETRKVADEALQRSANLDILRRPQKPIEFVKEKPPANSYHRDGWDIARQEADLSADKFHDLNLKPVEMWTEQETAQMKLVRDRVPVPDRNTEMRKVIPEDDIEKMMRGQYDSKIGGYVAKGEDVSHLKTYDEVKETFRLDYRNTAFTEGTDTYGLIKYQIEEPELVKIPYDKRFGGNTKNAVPCTRNGFLACRNGEVVPEWQAPRELPQDGAKLYRVKDGVEELVGEFDPKKGKFVPPKEQ